MTQTTDIQALAKLMDMKHPDRHDLLGWAGAADTDWMRYSNDSLDVWWIAQREDDGLWQLVHYHYDESTPDDGGYELATATLLP